MNNFIENVSRTDIAAGFHSDAGLNSMLIQIAEKGDSFPKPVNYFKETYQFSFDDVEDPDDEDAISDEQAEELARLLRRAKEQNMNVIVHCFAGLCRSGAVAECGISLGFNPPDRMRIPNTLVKKKIMKALGHEINEKTSVFSEEFYNRTWD